MVESESDSGVAGLRRLLGVFGLSVKGSSCLNHSDTSLSWDRE